MESRLMPVMHEEQTTLATAQGELARERIASQTARDEAAHWKDVACRLQEQIDQLKRKRGEKA